jgi:hypothetical protein
MDLSLRDIALKKLIELPYRCGDLLLRKPGVDSVTRRHCFSSTCADGTVALAKRRRLSQVITRTTISPIGPEF